LDLNCIISLPTALEEVDILKICLTCSLKSYKRGDRLWNQGDKADRIGYVLRGNIMLTKKNP